MFESFSTRDFVPTLAALAGLLLLMFGILWAVKRGIARMADRMKEEDRNHLDEIEIWASQLNTFLRRFLELVAGVAAIFIVMKGLGVQGLPAISWETVTFAVRVNASGVGCSVRIS